MADAVIMVRLFSELWACGVVMVATSNRAPHELYQVRSLPRTARSNTPIISTGGDGGAGTAVGREIAVHMSARRAPQLVCCGGGQDGINRPYFVPFLTLLSRQCLVLAMGSDTDHRLGFQHVHGSYHSPLGRCGPPPTQRPVPRPPTHCPCAWMGLGLQTDGRRARRRLRQASGR